MAKPSKEVILSSYFDFTSTKKALFPEDHWLAPAQPTAQSSGTFQHTED